MRWMHLVIAASVLAWIGCGGAPSGDVSTPSAATDDHDSADGHDHGTEAHSVQKDPEPADGSNSEVVQPEPAAITVSDEAPALSDYKSPTPVHPETPAPDERSATESVSGDVGSTGLAAHHAATTLVGRGDKLPELTVTDLEGNDVTLGSLREGARAFVLVFWDSQIDLSKLELEYLEKNLAVPRADEGVRVVAINRGETPEVVRQVVEAHGVTFPVLLDPDRVAFGQLATKTVPRTYVIAPDGTVRNLWVGFTGQGTISEIQKEIDAVLGE